MLRNIKITIEYDGTDFSGWQVQPNKRTVQGVLQNALAEFLGKKTKIIGAGRTDTGVHAIAQVANFSMKKNYDEHTIMNALNANLPNDIFVINAKEVDSKFHSRFDATSRVYLYRITKKYSVFERNYAWHCSKFHDIILMKKGIKFLLGKKDLTSFAIAKSKKENMYIDVKRCEWKKKKDELIFQIEADRFLHKSVRTIVGTFVLIGERKLKPQDIGTIIAAKDRKMAGKTAPPYGLYLKEVKY